MEIVNSGGKIGKIRGIKGMFAEVIKLVETRDDETSRDTRQCFEDTISAGFIEQIRYQN